MDIKNKTILFIADKPNWAYHFIIKTWAELMPEYQCYVAFSQDFQIRPKKFGIIDILKNKIRYSIKNEKMSFKISPDRNYSFPYYKKPPVYEVITDKKVEITNFDIIVEMAYYFQYTSELPFSADKRLVGIYTDCFPHEGPSFDFKKNKDLKTLDRELFYNNYLKSYDGIVVGNTNLYDDYKPFTDKIVFANGIYLQDQFIENKNVGKNKHITIAWTGNPNREMKGFRTIIEPAIKKVQSMGKLVNIKTKFSGDYKDLLSFYKDVDIVVIASSADTGPSLFAEASLCNVPCVSTNIGFPKMVIKNDCNGLIVSRNVDEVCNAIITLYDDREKLISFSKKIKQDYLSVLGNHISINNLKQFIKSI